jgi:DNA-binding response OmpR family regulator
LTPGLPTHRKSIAGGNWVACGFCAWSRNDLLDEVWSTEYEGYQRNVDPHINRLRRKIEPDPKNPQYVLTVRGVGYKLNEAP